jgi:sugar phosphate isomerase/epimerase
MTELGFHCHDLNHFDMVIVSNGLLRGEFYNFSPDALSALMREIERHNLASSVHAPLVKSPWYPSPPTLSYLCDVDEGRRRLSRRMVRETMETAAGFGAEYVVVHFPTPPLARVDGVSYQELKSIAWDSAVFLAKLAQKHRVQVHCEGFGPSPFLTPDFVNEVTGRLPWLRYCFDVGHMHVASIRDGFDLYEFARQVAPRVGSVHLWNNRGAEDYFSFGHIPVHPTQRPEDGWVDVARVLGIIMSGNPGCRIILESGVHYPQALGGHDFRDGVKWVKGLLGASF